MILYNNFVYGPNPLDGWILNEQKRNGAIVAANGKEKSEACLFHEEMRNSFLI